MFQTPLRISSATSAHNAFTDLIYFQHAFFCVYREGEAHVCDNGALRILRSEDGTHWESTALITQAGFDLRDGKFSLTPDGRLMLNGAGVRRNVAPITPLQSLCWLSDDGYQWTEGRPIGQAMDWLWSCTWQDDTAYAVSYRCGMPNHVNHTTLYHAPLGETFSPLLEPMLENRGYINEASLCFLQDQSALCLQRCDPGEGLIGQAAPPYTDWTWHTLNQRIGGPKLIELPNGRLIAGYREHTKEDYRTVIGELDLQSHTLTPLATLLSSGDTSYPGLVWHDNQLWVSYYSSHEGQTHVYITHASV